MRYPSAIASFKLGLGVKTEGDLVISGTKGYAYVSAPWWKTDYFELRYEDINLNKNIFMYMKVKDYAMNCMILYRVLITGSPILIDSLIKR